MEDALLKELYRRQEELEAELDKIHQMIALYKGEQAGADKGLKPKFSVSAIGSSITPVPWKNRINSALEHLSEADPSEIAKYITERFGGEGEKNFKTVGQYLPGMFKDGLVTREPKGKTYTYKLKVE